MPAFFAKKHLGQHFLNDHAIIERILDSLHPQPNEQLVEIGSGTGNLSRPLLATGNPCTLIEFDHRFIPVLQKQCQAFQQATLHQANALTFDFNTIAQPFRVVGNLPYNIATALLFHLFSFSNLQDIHVMLQHELAVRLCASPNNKQYGKLSVMAQYHCQTEYLFTIPPEAFSPKPKVSSAFVRLTPFKTLPHLAQDFSLFKVITTTAFNQRRKTIKNALQKKFPLLDWKALKIAPHQRPEQLSLQNYVMLSNWIVQQRHKDN